MRSLHGIGPETLPCSSDSSNCHFKRQMERIFPPEILWSFTWESPLFLIPLPLYQQPNRRLSRWSTALLPDNNPRCYCGLFFHLLQRDSIGLFFCAATERDFWVQIFAIINLMYIVTDLANLKTDNFLSLMHEVNAWFFRNGRIIRMVNSKMRDSNSLILFINETRHCTQLQDSWHSFQVCKYFLFLFFETNLQVLIISIYCDEFSFSFVKLFFFSLLKICVMVNLSVHCSCQRFLV